MVAVDDQRRFPGQAAEPGGDPLHLQVHRTFQMALAIAGQIAHVENCGSGFAADHRRRGGG
ncbi:hypothetical protein SDC9_191680 [bioreactor metagenome]|uniref:Uncharacterized protein n=1 Tax=bioreactor metagenome TaxID=1076179 RepID=A0A645I102_9ZZZZ